MATRVVTAIFVIAGIVGCSQMSTTLPSGPVNVASSPGGNLSLSKPTLKFFNTPSLGAWPENIISGPQGALWFAEFDTDKIGRIATSGQVTEFPLPDGNDIEDLTEGADGNLGSLSPAPTKSAA